MPALVWFGMGAAFCWLAERVRRAGKDDFEERLAALEDEVTARLPVETH